MKTAITLANAALLASFFLFATGEAVPAADRTETVRFEAGASAASMPRRGK